MESLTNLPTKILLVSIIMGSRSDWDTMGHASELLGELAIPHECQIVSAHRTPDWMFDYATTAEERGLRVIIAGAGGAAHLPGMTAAKTVLPVLAVPVRSWTLQGFDSLLSIVQMPKGVPVAAHAIGEDGAVNTALQTAEILALSDANLRERLQAYRGKTANQTGEDVECTWSFREGRSESSAADNLEGCWPWKVAGWDIKLAC